MSLGEPAAWDAQAGGAERKQVSVLFADLVGFTSMSESRDAEEVREQLTEYFSLASEVIGRYGGTVEKFIGDAVMAVWGTPVAHEDDAERAVRAALELVSAVQAMSQPGHELALRAGVLTGEAAVSLGATNQGLVAGDLVNTASRLQSVAPPGTVLVGETTYHTASRAIVFEPVGDQDLKGKSSPVPAFRAIRVVAQRGGVGRADQLEAPFLGRDGEFQLVKDLFHATKRERRPRLVSIMGQGGIGKSRLAWEFLKYIDGILETVRWHQGRSPAYGEGITFWALGEMVRSRVGLLEGDDEATTRSRIDATLREFVADEAERRWIQPALEHLLGIGGSAAGGREELFSAWRTFFERVAGDDAAVLVFEDVHWADAGLLDFIEHLLTWARSSPILIVTLARPELIERRPNWGAGQRNFTNLSLEPLPDEVIRAILESLVPGLPDEVAAPIAARAEGIPLYAVETVRMLLQDGRLEKSNGVFQMVGDLSNLEVPSTLQALIAARLDALDPVDRSLLQQASVLGQTFTMPALSAISGERDGLEERLLGLVRREMLTVDADPRSPERGQYGFVQALVRDVAYNTLSRRDRKVVHLAAAEYYQSLDDDEIVDATAMHFLDAYRSAPDDAGADESRRKATELLQRAASRATLLGSHEQAVRFLELALDVTTDIGERVDLLIAAGTTAASAGLYEIAEGYARRGVQAARDEGDVLGEARGLNTLARILTTNGRPTQAIEEVLPALERIEALGSEQAVVGVHAALARAYMISADSKAAVDWCDRALPMAEQLDVVFVIADLLITRGTALASFGRVREGVAELQGALLLADSYGLTQAALRARVNLTASLPSEDPGQALRIGLEGIELATRTGYRDLIPVLASNTMLLAMRQGDFGVARDLADEFLLPELAPSDRWVILISDVVARAIRGEPYEPLFEEATRIAAASDEHRTASGQDGTMAALALVEGRFEEGHTIGARGLDGSNAIADEGTVAARSALWAGNLEAARTLLERMHVEAGHGRTIDALVRSVEAGVLALEGRTEDAVVAYDDAMRQFRAIDAKYELALCQLDFVRFIGGERPEIRAAAEEARTIFSAIPSPVFLRRLDEALGVPAHRE